jgi:hypothetical protein
VVCYSISRSASPYVIFDISVPLIIFVPIGIKPRSTAFLFLGSRVRTPLRLRMLLTYSMKEGPFSAADIHPSDQEYTRLYWNMIHNNLQTPLHSSLNWTRKFITFYKTSLLKPTLNHLISVQTLASCFSRSILLLTSEITRKLSFYIFPLEFPTTVWFNFIFTASVRQALLISD